MAALAIRSHGSIRRFLATVRDFCPRLLAEPLPGAVKEARKILDALIDMLAMSTAKAMSPFLRTQGRMAVLRNGRAHLDILLLLLDTLMRVPLCLLDAGELGRNEPASETLYYAVHNTIAFGMTLDRAADELGLPRYDGGPFALCDAGGAS